MLFSLGSFHRFYLCIRVVSPRVAFPLSEVYGVFRNRALLSISGQKLMTMFWSLFGTPLANVFSPSSSLTLVLEKCLMEMNRVTSPLTLSFARLHHFVAQKSQHNLGISTQVRVAVNPLSVLCLSSLPFPPKSPQDLLIVHLSFISLCLFVLPVLRSEVRVPEARPC